jgi:methylenetetrahydrofolate reductase (NADPH)
MTGKFTTSDIEFSLEVFPPKSEAGVERLLATVDSYTAFKPSMITVTFGAGNSQGIVMDARQTVKSIAARTHLPVAAHMTCANRSRAEVDDIVDSFWQDGVRHIVALRGDILRQDAPYSPHPEGYLTTPDFIASLKKRYPALRVSVAGYPETHPESPSVAFDIAHLKSKIDAGADDVLTQFFFDPEVFLRWRDKLTEAGVRAPLTPGLLPILNFPKTLSFAKKCNAAVPGFLHKMFDGIDPDSVDHKLLAMNVMSHQITRLIEHGVKSFHFYTLNDTLLTRHVCTWLRAGF